MRGEEPVRTEESLRSPKPVRCESPLMAVPGIAVGAYPSTLPGALAAPPALTGFLPRPAALDSATRCALRDAGREVLECRRVLAKAGLNVVGEVLRGQGEFVEMSHYPSDDVYDAETCSQYYYHAHRGTVEHGHFHTFLRSGNMPEDARPLPWPLASAKWPAGSAAICHLVAISMDAWGEPIGLFATNRWVTGESWYPADDAIRMLARFEIDHAFPSWPTNRWIGAMLRLYRPWIEGLIHHRDAVIEHWIAAHPGEDVFEDRTLEITGFMPIAVGQLIAELD